MTKHLFTVDVEESFLAAAHRFKRRWGAAARPLLWYRASPCNDLTAQQDRGAISLATRVWRRVPLPVATTVGSRLRGGIPS